MKAKHTPAPWSMLSGDTLAGHRQVVAAAIGSPLQTVATVHAFEPGDAESTANARLIAAAPAMLDKLAYLHQLLCLQPAPKLGEWNWPQIAADVRDVIHLATGE